MIRQGFNPDLGNPAVRHYRGAMGTVRHGETVTPHLQRGAPDFYPDPSHRGARDQKHRRRARAAAHVPWGLRKSGAPPSDGEAKLGIDNRGTAENILQCLSQDRQAHRPVVAVAGL
jgi:hypothetical protein